MQLKKRADLHMFVITVVRVPVRYTLHGPCRFFLKVVLGSISILEQKSTVYLVGDVGHLKISKMAANMASAYHQTCRNRLKTYYEPCLQ